MQAESGSTKSGKDAGRGGKTSRASADQNPGKRVGFLVVHGIGQQNPFETLDSFVRGLIDYFDRQSVPISVEHRLAMRSGLNESQWTESFVRVSSPSAGWQIDVHEYYWAPLTEAQVNRREILAWVQKTISGLKRLDGHRESDNEKLRAHWRALKTVGRKVRWVLPFVRFARMISKVLPRWVRKAFGAVFGALEDKASAILEGHVGDVVVYTTMDKKSRHYRTRRQILRHMEALFGATVCDDELGYDSLIVAGHSLGSVMAYDSLNRLAVSSNVPGQSDETLKRLGKGKPHLGLVTFGSPLDEVRFFFHEHAAPDQYVRRQIMNNLHGFRADPLDPTASPHEMENPATEKFPVQWVNYHAERDPLSGSLDFFRVDANVALSLKRRVRAHVEYWDHAPFYEDIVNRFLSDVLADSAGSTSMTKQRTDEAKL